MLAINNNEVVKIKFVDFWFGFIPNNNYFFKLLSQAFKIELCDDPTILIYSCFGTEHLRYNCTKVYYTGENFRPDFTGCDFAISFDYNTDSRHFRLPLYVLYIDQNVSMEKLVKRNSRQEALEIWKTKTKFCCMVVSNNQSKKRLNFFEKLSKYKVVDSGGKVLNNVGGPVKDKLAFIKDYRFVIAFENVNRSGYTTEKIIEPLLKDCIPLYWGNPLISRDFNLKCFLNWDNSKSEEEFIKQIVAVDMDEEKAIKILMEPKFANQIVPDDINKELLLIFFNKIVLRLPHKTPVSKTWRRYIHLYKIKKINFKRRLKGILNKII